jgi:zinc/manganese transport system substrate-binding protein
MHQSLRIPIGRIQLILRRSTAFGGVALLALSAAVAGCGGGSATKASSGSSTSAGPNAIRVVAAENFYGDITHQLGGSHVSVTSIISDPNADPHEYESSTADAKAIAAAHVVIENGVGYDSFMDKLLAASPNSARVVINVGDLLGRTEGDNPHVWYNVDWMGRLADKITATLQRLQPANAAEFTRLNQQFKASMQPISSTIAAIKAKHNGEHLTQTEPVFGYMGEALGLRIDDGDFQHAIEEGTDPPPQAVAQIDVEINRHQVKALLYNSQTVSPITDKVKALAKQQHLPVIGVSETEPAGKDYEQWMQSQLDTLQNALGG